jgi:hypothetical protein
MAAQADPAAAIAELEARGDWPGLIETLRDAVAADRRVLADTAVKAWCGRRWRNIFLEQAAADEQAVKASAKRLAIPGRDRREVKHRLAERFLRGPGIGDWELELPSCEATRVDNVTLVFCPGLVNGLLPAGAFETVFPALEKEYGWRFLRADAHPLRGCDANVDDLLATLEQGHGLDASNRPIPPEEQRPPGDVFLLGYSKGTADALTVLATHPEVAPRVRALVAWAGAAGGSFLADDIYESVKDLELDLGTGIEAALGTVLKLIAPVLGMDAMTARLEETDFKGAVRDLTTAVRGEFMRANGPALDALDIPFFHVTAATRPTEVPYFQMQGAIQLARHDPDNDMQLTQEQSKVPLPLGVDLAMLRAHHWDVSYEPFPLHARLGSPNLEHRFPRRAAIAATVMLLAELGVID